MKKIALSFLFICIISSVFSANIIPLSGKWQFATDPNDEGITKQWYSTSLSETIQLPGSMASNFKGNDITLDTKWTASNWSDSSWHKRPEFEKFRKVDAPKFSFWLTPVKEYVGAAWYQNTVKIPSNWKSRTVLLHLERCHWETTVWVNGKEMGMQNSLSTAHVYELTGQKAGKENRIAIRIDNRIKDINPGEDAHSVSDNTQTNWNGIVGDIYLEAKPQIYVASIKITPDIHKEVAKAEVTIVNNSSSASNKKILIETKSINSAVAHTAIPLVQTTKILAGKHQYSFEIEMGNDVQLWSEHQPALYEATVFVDKMKNAEAKTTFGMREIKSVGTQFFVNNQPVFLRGTLECAIFPLTGFPPTDEASWARIMNKIKSFGLNHIRFHSWCPPNAAFDAADKAGVYLQIEAAAWARIGNDKGIDKFVYDESERIVNNYGNHPSFCLMAYGNEPHGENHKKYLTEFVAFWKTKDHRRVYTTGAGWPEVAENDYHNIPAPRIQRWAEGLKSSINAKAPQLVSDYSSIIQSKTVPVVSHEIGQWCAFPNFDEMKKYTGVLKPKNFELFQEHLNDKKMGHQAHDFLMASGKLQTLCYKADIEAALRTKNMGGFQLLDLHDFPGQGSALIGVLDAFWDEKGYVTANEFSQFCNKVVPLARLTKMLYTNADTLMVDIELANFGGVELKQAAVKWEIIDDKNAVVKSGIFEAKNYPVGNGWLAGKINVKLNDFKTPSKYTIRTSVADTKYTNQWDIWVYEKVLTTKENNIVVTDKFDDETIKQLADGKNVLLTLRKSMLKPEMGGSVEMGFSTVFWNTSWTKNQAPHTLGIFCDPQHPALAQFPTEYHSNWQWWDILKDGAAICTDAFPVDFKTLVQPIHTWFDNKRLALVFETNMLNGKLMVVGADLNTDLENRLASRQLKYSIINYMQSNKFAPTNVLVPADIQSLLK